MLIALDFFFLLFPTACCLACLYFIVENLLALLAAAQRADEACDQCFEELE